LPGSEALLKSGIGKGNFRYKYCFYFYLLFYFVMENSRFGSLFGNATAFVTVEDEPPPAQLDPFKIPMKIVERVMNNRYLGDGTVHPGDWWHGVDDVNDRPVGNPKRRCDEHNSKFSLS
jgi:hypothetical protein